MSSSSCFLFLAFFLATVYSQTACLSDNQCYSSSVNPNYVSCVSGACRCKTSLGFVGSATATDQCRCDAPYEVVRKSEVPYCIRLQDAADYKNQGLRNATMLETIADYHNYFFWPAVVDVGLTLIANTTNHPIYGLVAPDVRYRIDGLGEFEGVREVLTFPVSQHLTGQAFTNQFLFKEFVASGNAAYGQISQFYTLFTAPPPNNVTKVDAYNVTHHGKWEFDNQNRIKSGDLSIRNLGWQISDVFESDDGSIQNSYKDLTCAVVVFEGECTTDKDPSGQRGFFANFSDCRSHMDLIPYGKWDHLRAQNVLCSFFHGIGFNVDKTLNRCQEVCTKATRWCYNRDATTFYDTGRDGSNVYRRIGSIPSGSRKKRAIDHSLKLEVLANMEKNVLSAESYSKYKEELSKRR